MDIKVIEYKGKKYAFDVDVTWEQVNKWNKNNSNPKGYNFKWFYEKTKYGEFILNKLLMYKEQDGLRNPADEIEVDEDDWYKFIPVLKELFQTYKEFWDVANNLKFLAGSPNHLPREDSYFREYMMIRNGFIEMPTYKDLQKMDYKKALMLNNYVLSEETLDQTIRMKKFLDHLKSTEESEESRRMTL